MTEKEKLEEIWQRKGVMNPCHINRWEIGFIARPGRLNNPLRDKKAWARIKKNCPNYAKDWK